jgi:hypothetical protein
VHDALIESLCRAVDAAPDDIALRLHLADLLIQADRASEAVGLPRTGLHIAYGLAAASVLGAVILSWRRRGAVRGRRRRGASR